MILYNIIWLLTCSCLHIFCRSSCMKNVYTLKQECVFYPSNKTIIGNLTLTLSGVAFFTAGINVPNKTICDRMMMIILLSSMITNREPRWLTIGLILCHVSLMATVLSGHGYDC